MALATNLSLVRTWWEQLRKAAFISSIEGALDSPSRRTSRCAANNGQELLFLTSVRLAMRQRLPAVKSLGGRLRFIELSPALANLPMPPEPSRRGGRMGDAHQPAVAAKSSFSLSSASDSGMYMSGLWSRSETASVAGARCCAWIGRVLLACARGHRDFRVCSVALQGFCWRPGMQASLIAGRHLLIDSKPTGINHHA